MTAPDELARLPAAAMRMAAGAALRRVPTALWRRLCPKTALGVCYHAVSDADLPHIRHYPLLDSTAFAADLAYLRQTFGFISHDRLAERLGQPNAARDNAAIVTFDDGFAECASIAAPILRRHGADAVFFLVTDLIDNAVLFRESLAALCIGAVLAAPVERVETIARALGLEARLRPPPAAALFDPGRSPLDIAGLRARADRRLWPPLHWLLTLGAADAPLLQSLAARLGVDPPAYLRTAKPYLTTPQIRQLRADGFTIGAHGRDHRWLQGLPLAEAEAEIVESCRIVRDITGQASVPFAFPYFGGGLDRGWLAELRRRHPFIGLFFDTDGLREDAPFVVQRVFGERFGHDRTLDATLRRAWSRRPAWRPGG